MKNPAIAAIEYALSIDEPEAVLRYWFEGEFDSIRNEWPSVPEEVFIGADPLHPETKRMLAAQPELSISAELLYRVIESMGRFCSDEGWCQIDMDRLDELIAAVENQEEQ